MIGQKVRRYGARTVEWAGKYPFAPRYPRTDRRTIAASDGTRLRLHHVGGPQHPSVAYLVVHGLFGSSRSPRVHAFAHSLSRYAPVAALDLRGHGASSGVCGLGVSEPLDVVAAIGHIRAMQPGLPIVVVGTSLGAISSLLAAGEFSGAQKLAGVFAISGPAWFGDTTRPSAKRTWALLESRRNRLLARVFLSTRMAAPPYAPIVDPRRAVAAIAPGFVVIAHDPQDSYFGPQHAESLYSFATGPKELWWLAGSGHGTDVLDAAFAERVHGATTGFLSDQSTAETPSSTNDSPSRNP